MSIILVHHQYMIYAPTNRILLKLDKLYTDELITEGGLKLYFDPSFSPEWNVTCTGTVAALPRKALPDLQIGDKVYFTYHIVNERKWEDDKKFFVRNNLGNEYIREYTDKLGGTIKVMRFPNGKGFAEKWGAAYINEYQVHIDGCQGSEKDIDRWLAANFQYGYAQQMKYKNLIEISGDDFWIAKDVEIFAIKRGDELIATPGYAICKPLRIDIGMRVAIAEGIQVPENTMILIPEDRGEIIAMGPEKGMKISAKKGNTVLFNKKLVEKYEFDGEKLFVVKHNRILAIV